MRFTSVLRFYHHRSGIGHAQWGRARRCARESGGGILEGEKCILKPDISSEKIYSLRRQQRLHLYMLFSEAEQSPKCTALHVSGSWTGRTTQQRLATPSTGSNQTVPIHFSLHLPTDPRGYFRELSPFLNDVRINDYSDFLSTLQEWVAPWSVQSNSVNQYWRKKEYKVDWVISVQVRVSRIE